MPMEDYYAVEGGKRYKAPSKADWDRGVRQPAGDAPTEAAPKPVDTSEDEKYGKMSEDELNKLPPLQRGAAITKRRRWQSAHAQAEALKSGAK